MRKDYDDMFCDDCHHHHDQDDYHHQVTAPQMQKACASKDALARLSAHRQPKGRPDHHHDDHGNDDDHHQ